MIMTLFKHLYAQLPEEHWHRLSGFKKCKQMINHIKEFPTSSSVLEIGTAEGAILRYLKKHSIIDKGVGYDISKDRIEVAIKKTKKAGMSESLSFCVGNGQVLPFQDSSFDIVMLPHVLEHIPHMSDIASLINDSLRVSRNGLLIVIPMRDSNEWLPSLSKYLNFDHIRNLVMHQNHWVYHSNSLEDFFCLLGLKYRRSTRCDRYYFIAAPCAS